MNPAPIELTVIGVPAPQGSKTRMPNGAMVDGTSATGRAKLVEWRRAVTDAARTHLTDHPDQATIVGPVFLTVTFRFTATKSDPHRHHHAVAPDASKILRATEDALVAGGLLSDDRLICDLSISKRWCRPGEHPGAWIRIEDLTAAEANSRQARQLAARVARTAAKAAS